MKRVLVTGGAGFIGSHVVDAYVEAGCHVAVVDNLTTGKRSNLNPRAAFYELDIRDVEALTRIFATERPEIVNHHAAQPQVRRSVFEPQFDASINILGALNVLECARSFGTRQVIYISSGGAIYGEPEYLPCDEGHRIHPLSPCGASKYAIEIYLGVYRQTHRLATTVLRYANVYGPRQDPSGEAGVVAIFAGQMPRGVQPMVYGSGNQARDFMSVSDCARANVLATDLGTASSDTVNVFNIGTGHPTTVDQVVEHLKILTGYTDEIKYGPEQPGEVFTTYLNCTRAKDVLGWTSLVNLAEGLASTVEYMRPLIEFDPELSSNCHNHLFGNRSNDV